jgi:DNA-binding transcriptional MerR regulator
MLLAEYRAKKSQKIEKTYIISEAAQLVGLNADRIGYYARNGIGKIIGNRWIFTDADIELLKNRPAARHRK